MSTNRLNSLDLQKNPLNRRLNGPLGKRMNTEEEQYYKDKIEARIQQQRAELEEIKASAADRSAEVKSTLADILGQLESGQKEMEERFAQLNTASGKAWEILKDDFLEAWHQVNEDLSRAKQHLNV